MIVKKNIIGMENKSIDFVLAVRNRENERIQRCINSFKEIANKIFVVDYNSDKPIKLKDCEIIRKEGKEYKIWNKSYALNCGIKKSEADYICTIDCDMILTKDILNAIEKEINENTVIFNTNVCRIELKDISEDYEKMIKKSKPWFEENPRNNIYSSANGGIQVFPRKWINLIGGYDEGIGLYWGAMDNRLFEQAKMDGMTIIDLNIPMFHQEHSKQKEANLPKEEIEFAEKVRLFKIGYLKQLISEGNIISKRSWGGDKPNHEWMIELVKGWEKTLIKRPKVCISIISNFKYIPTYFALNLIRIMENARENGIPIIINNIYAPAVDSIRNYSVLDALCKGATHIVQLDDDHIYPDDMIIRLLEHKKDFVCGVTNRKITPFTQTQFYDVDLDIVNSEGNICNFKEDDGLVKIEGTGMVGSLINLDVFEKIKFPFYNREYDIVDDKIRETGEDIYFCRKYKKAGFEMFCDTSLNYPHQINNAFVDRGSVTLQ